MAQTTAQFLPATTSGSDRASGPHWDNSDAFDKAKIASLSATQISEMTRTELIRVIENTSIPVAAGRHNVHVVCADRQTLERLAFLARRCCQNQGY